MHMNKNLMIVTGTSGCPIEAQNILKQSKINVICAKDFSEAKAGLFTYSPAFVLVNYNIKEFNSLFMQISSSQIDPRPYIMVAGVCKNGDERASMLKRGADHCVDYPINANEIAAVIESVFRRSANQSTVRYKELAIHMSTRTVTMKGEPVALTRREYDVLCVLAAHVGAVVKKEEIYHSVWRCDYTPKNTNVSDQISSLRAKLGLNGKDSTYIRTVIGVGYTFGAITE